MKILKRSLVVIALLMLAVCVFCMRVSASEIVASGSCGRKGDNLTWTLYADGGLSISGEGEMADYTSSSVAPGQSMKLSPWPAESVKTVLIEDGVTGIGDYAFAECLLLMHAEIPDSVTRIGGHAFYDCESLKAIQIPDSVKSIGNGAFALCYSLSSVNLPNGLTSIEACVFDLCPIRSIEIPDSVTSIKDGAFAESGLVSIEIPASVTSIEGDVFAGCSNLESIHVHEENPNYSSDKGGALYDKSKSTLLRVPEGIEGYYAIRKGVRTIGRSAMHSCDGLTCIEIPDSVICIENYGFSYCSTDKDCDGEDDSIDLFFRGDAPALNGSDVFRRSIANAYYPADNPTWTDDVMQEDHGGEVTWIPLGDIVASGPCGRGDDPVVWTLYADGGLVISGEGGVADFYRYSNDEEHIGEIVIETPWRPYLEQITYVDVKDGVTWLGEKTFYGCVNLSAISIPESISYIEDVFEHGHVLDMIYFTGDAIFGFKDDCTVNTVYYPCWGRNYVLLRELSTIKVGEWVGLHESGVTEHQMCLHGDPNAEGLYTGICGKDGDNLTWTLDGSGVLTISGEGEMTYGGYTYHGDIFCDSPWEPLLDKITSVVICDGVTSVGELAFWGMDSLRDITIPPSVRKFGADAFWCPNLEKVYISDIKAYITAERDFHRSYDGDGGGVQRCTATSPTYYADELYLNGKLVTDLEIPEGITSIPQAAFAGYKKLKNVYFPQSLALVADGAFQDCTIENLYMGDCSAYFKEYVFHNSTIENLYVNSLKIWLSNLYDISYMDGSDGCAEELAISANPLYVAENFYVDGKRVEEITIPDTVTEIPTAAFAGYQKLKKAVIPGTVQKVDAAAFYKCIGLKEIVFEDDAPEAGFDLLVCSASSLCSPEEHCEYCLELHPFTGVTATAYYPADKQTWTEEAMKAFGGSITWVPYTEPLKITKQPENTFAKLGTSASVTLEAEGEGLTYAWYVQDIGDTEWFPSKHTTSTYKMTMTEQTAGRKAYCVITDQYGNTVTSDTVELCLAASIKTQPKTTYADYNKTAKITVEAVGDDLTYQWYVSDEEDGAKYFASSQKTNTYTLKMTPANSNRRAYCVVTDKHGNRVTSSTARLRMCATITAQSKTTYTKQGASAKATVTAVGDGLTYQWYIKNAGAAKYSKSSVTSANYSCKMSSTSKDRLVYCVVTDQYGKTARTETVRLRMAATVTEQSKTTYTRQGGSAKATVTAVGDGLTYQWYIKNAGAAKYSKSSITSSTYSVKMSSTSKDRLVYCIVTDKYGNTDRSETVRLRMAATITTQPKNVSGASGTTVKTTVKAEGDGLTYQWYIKNPGKTAFSKSSITTATYSCKMSTSVSGRQVYCVVTDKYGKTHKSNTVTLSMA